MKHLLSLICAMFFVVSVFSNTYASEKNTTTIEESLWLTDFNKAKQVSKDIGKPILIDFSGSDWCGWCVKLDKEIFSREIFKKYAKENLVLMMVDFPRNKKQSNEVKKQNKALLKKYSVRGFPTVFLVDSEGKVLARTGYRRGGAQKYVDHLKKILDPEYKNSR